MISVKFMVHLATMHSPKICHQNKHIFCLCQFIVKHFAQLFSPYLLLPTFVHLHNQWFSIETLIFNIMMMIGNSKCFNLLEKKQNQQHESEEGKKREDKKNLFQPENIHSLPFLPQSISTGNCNMNAILPLISSAGLVLLLTR